MRRRDFVRGVTAVSAAWPLAARAQQSPAQPLIGFLSTRSPEEAAIHTSAFRRGLEEMGYIEGRSVAIEYRWAKGDYSQLPPLVADLRSRPLSVIVATGDPAAQAAKAAGFAVPLVFVVGQDPVRAGLVASMNRPGTATGVNFSGDLGGKRLELLCTLVPAAHVVGLLLNPSFGMEAVDQFQQSVAAAAQSLGRELAVQKAHQMLRSMLVLQRWLRPASPPSWCRTIHSSTLGGERSLRCRLVTSCPASSTSGSFQPVAG